MRLKRVDPESGAPVYAPETQAGSAVLAIGLFVVAILCWPFARLVGIRLWQPDGSVETPGWLVAPVMAWYGLLALWLVER